MKNTLTETFFAVSGAVLLAFAVVSLASPAGLVTGGVSGVGIVVKALTGGKLPIFVTSLFLNVPLFVISALQRGLKFIAKSSVAFMALTLALAVFENTPLTFDFEGDVLVATLFYALISGVGIGFILRSGATSGGTDMLAAIIKYKNPAHSISRLIAVIDGTIILLGTFVFGLRLTLYSVLALFLSARVIDLVMFGVSSAKAVFIVSDKSEDIARRISSELERGATGIPARGMYTGSERVMLLVVVSSRELSLLRKIVGECDESAFVTVTDAKYVLGEGFDKVFQSPDSFS